LAEESDYGLALSRLNAEIDSIIWPDLDLTDWQTKSLSANDPDRIYLDLKESLQIFPNPVLNEAYISYPVEVEGKGVLNIYDSNGRLVQSIESNKTGISSIDFSNLSNGLYSVNLSIGKHQISNVKFIKE